MLPGDYTIYNPLYLERPAILLPTSHDNEGSKSPPSTTQPHLYGAPNVASCLVGFNLIVAPKNKGSQNRPVP